jgi:hypothetical protein
MKKFWFLPSNRIPAPFTRKQEVRAARAENAVAIGVHLEQVFPPMQPRNLLFVPDLESGGDYVLNPLHLNDRAASYSLSGEC